MKTHAHMIPGAYANNGKIQGQVFYRVLHPQFQMALAHADDIAFDRSRYRTPRLVPPQPLKPSRLAPRLLMQVSAPAGHHGGTVDVSDHLLRVVAVHHRQSPYVI